MRLKQSTYFRLQARAMLLFTAYFSLYSAFQPMALAEPPKAPEDAQVAAPSTAPVVPGFTPILNYNIASAGQSKDFGDMRLEKIKPYRTVDDFLPPNKALWHSKGALDFVYAEYVQKGMTPTIFNKALQAMYPHKTQKQRAEKAAELGRGWVESSLLNAFAEYTKYLEDPREPVEAVVIRQFVDRPISEKGSELSPKDMPPGAEPTVAFYKAAGFKVEESFFDVGELEKHVNQVQRDTQDKTYLLSFIKNDETLKKLNPDALTPPKNSSAVWTSFKQALGLIRGMSFVQFKLAKLRSPKERQYEFLATAIVTSLGVWGANHAIQKDIASGKHLNAWLPLLIVLADKVFYTYMQRAVSATFGQGLSYNYDRDLKNPNSPQFVPNVKFFLLASFVNSVVLRVAQLSAAHVDIDLHNFLADGSVVLHSTVTTALVMGAVGSSLRGVFSKGPLQFLVEKIRTSLAKHPFHQILVLSIWNGLWGIGQVFDIYDLKVGDFDLPGLGMTKVGFREVMTVLAAAGAIIMAVKNWNSLKRTLLFSDSSPCDRSLLQFRTPRDTKEL